MRSQGFTLLLLGAAAFLSGGGASAEQPAPATIAQASPSVGQIVIGEIERRIIGDYYQQRYDEWYRATDGGKQKKGKKVPPGLAKKGGLPPGIAKQLRAGGALPPGLAYQNLPRDLSQQLPPPQPGYRYVIIDGKVLLVQIASNLILDMLQVAAAEL